MDVQGERGLLLKELGSKHGQTGEKACGRSGPSQGSQSLQKARAKGLAGWGTDLQSKEGTYAEHFVAV